MSQIKKSILITRRFMSERSRKNALLRSIINLVIYATMLITGILVAPKTDVTFTHILSVTLASIGVQGLFHQLLKRI